MQSGASRVAIDDVDPALTVMESRPVNDEFPRERANVVDRPGDAPLVAQGPVIVEFVGWRHQEEIEGADDKNMETDIDHFAFRRKGRGLATVVD